MHPSGFFASGAASMAEKAMLPADPMDPTTWPIPAGNTRVLGVKLGWTVELHSLQQTECNGLRGLVVSFDEARGRIGVKCETKSLNVKPVNVRRVPTEGVRDDIELADSIVEFMDEGELDALDDALEDEEWARAVEILGTCFAVAAPGTTLGELRKTVADTPAYAQWADPRVDSGWPSMSALDQWNTLSTFLFETVDRLGFTVSKALELPQVEVGMSHACLREGFSPRGKLTKDILYEAFMDVLVKNFLRKMGTLEFMSTSEPGRGWCIIAAILDGGVGAICYALGVKSTDSRPSILRLVTAMAIERMRAADDE